MREYIPFFMMIIIFIFVYGLANYYVGLRGWQLLTVLNPMLNAKIYWIIFWVIALSYIIGRVLVGVLPSPVANFMIMIGSYWMAILLYSFFLALLIDLIKLLNHYLHFIPPSLMSNNKFSSIICIICLAFIAIIVGYGTYNAKNPIVKHYDVTVNKNAGDLKDLHVVMVSDIHLGKLVGSWHLQRMVNMVNGLKPDIVLLGGDIIDESVEPVMEKDMSSILSSLKSKYGTYGILGNHEYYAGHSGKIVEYLNSAGVTVLQDQYTKINNGFYLVGREDRAVLRTTGNGRKDLKDILRESDNIPIILLDHEPFAVEEAKAQKIDLMLSGHTHHGQLFPGSLITNSLFTTDWGHYKDGDFNLIVTSGFGTWGPPIRIGNRPEVVDLTVHFE